MSNIQVIDDFLPAQVFFNIQDQITSSTFPWFVSNSTVGLQADGDSACNDLYNWQMYHLFYDSSNLLNAPTAPILNPFLERLDPVLLLRLKANLNPIAHEVIEHGLHIDIYPEELAEHSTTGVFYLNTNNGYTIFEDGTKVDSVENRLVLFPSTMKHSGTTCTDQPFRLVLNVNFILKGSDIDKSQHEFYKNA